MDIQRESAGQHQSKLCNLPLDLVINNIYESLGNTAKLSLRATCRGLKKDLPVPENFTTTSLKRVHLFHTKDLYLDQQCPLENTETIPEGNLLCRGCFRAHPQEDFSTSQVPLSAEERLCKTTEFVLTLDSSVKPLSYDELQNPPDE